MTEVIRCQGLTKRYGSTVAVDGLDLVVEAGQVFGFLGPNGAGKTLPQGCPLSFPIPTPNPIRSPQGREAECPGEVRTRR